MDLIRAHHSSGHHYIGIHSVGIVECGFVSPCISLPFLFLYAFSYWLVEHTTDFFSVKSATPKVSCWAQPRCLFSFVVSVCCTRIRWMHSANNWDMTFLMHATNFATLTAHLLPFIIITAHRMMHFIHDDRFAWFIIDLKCGSLLRTQWNNAMHCEGIRAFVHMRPVFICAFYYILW